MKIGELLNILKNQTMQSVADQVGISPGTIRKRLKQAGFEYDPSKTWHWPHPTDAPFDLDISDMDKTDRKTPGTPEESITYRTGSPEPFTGSEIRMLREFIQEWQKGQQKGSRTPQNASQETLHDRIKVIPNETKKRKTIVINKSASDRLDRFAQANRVDKQDVLFLAIMDFIDRYE